MCLWSASWCPHAAGLPGGCPLRRLPAHAGLSRPGGIRPANKRCKGTCDRLELLGRLAGSSWAMSSIACHSASSLFDGRSFTGQLPPSSIAHRRSSATVWLPYALADFPQGFGIDPEHAASLLEIVTEFEFPSQQGRQVAGRDDGGVLVRLLQHLAGVVAAGCRHRWGAGGSGIG